MKKLCRPLLLLFFMICANISMAQDGTIRGTIVDGANGEPLIGVNILVEGTSRGTSTDVEGKFDLSVPEGAYNLRISYISYQTKTVQGVNVTSDEINVLGTVQLLTETRQMEEVVVTAEAVKDTEAALLTKKKKLPNMIDGISAEVIDQSGISKASEALRKVTGVSIEGGKYVYVRGLGGRYTKTMLNSVEIPSLDPNKNSLQVDIFPTNLIDNMIISKTAVAQLPADFTGGIVNIETKDFPARPILDVSASVSYNPQMHFNDNFFTYDGSNTDFLGFDNGNRALPNRADAGAIPTPIDPDDRYTDQDVYNFTNSFNQNLGPKQATNTPDYSLGLTLGNQFDAGGNNKLGYILTATYRNSSEHFNNYRFGEYQTQTGASNYDLIYATKQNGSVSNRDILAGGLAGLAFKTPNSKYKLTAMHLQNGESKATNFFIDNSEDAPGQSGYLGDSYNLEYSERGISNILLNGNHYFSSNKWQVDWRLSSTFSSITDPDIRNTTYTLSRNGDLRFNSGAGGFPSRLWRYLDEVNLVGRMNVARDYELFDRPATLKFGGSHVYKQRDYKILSFGMSFFGTQPGLTGNPDDILKNSNVFGNGEQGVIFYQSGNSWPNPNAYKSNSNNTAFYISNNFTLAEAFKLHLGLRAEQFTLRHTGRDQRFAQGASDGINLENEKVLDSFDLFPSANLTYFLSHGMNLRFSYSQTIARPTFKELSFAQISDPVSGRAFNGGLYAIGSWDGDLGETRINNVDLRWERFFGGDQLLSASVFYKTFDDPIELVRLRVNTTGNDYQPRNVGNGRVYGVEFEIRKSLRFISSALSNFGFNSNLTLVQSYIDMTEEEFQARKSREKEGQDIDDTRQMAGQAPFLINVGITYANPANGFEGGLFYNVKEKTLIRVGGGLFPDVYSEPFHSLNFNLNKSFGRASLSLSVDNILNDTRAEYYQAYKAGDEIFSRYKPHRSVSLGIKYSF